MADTTSDIDRLMNETLGYAEKLLLHQDEEFYPFAAAMRPDGEISLLSAKTGPELPGAEDYIAAFADALRQEAKKGEAIASAILYDVSVPDPDTEEMVDAIGMSLDHKDEYSMVIFVPYEVEEDSISFGELFGHDGENQIFGGPAPS